MSKEERDITETVSWDHIISLAKDLARQIESAKYIPDIILAISRGGWVPGRLLSDYLGIETLADITINMKVRTPSYVLNKKVLIVDDIADSGKTLKKVMEFAVNNMVKDLRTATLFYKVTSIVHPNWFAEETEAWIVFPWEEYNWRRKHGERITFRGDSQC